MGLQVICTHAICALIPDAMDTCAACGTKFEGSICCEVPLDQPHQVYGTFDFGDGHPTLVFARVEEPMTELRVAPRIPRH